MSIKLRDFTGKHILSGIETGFKIREDLCGYDAKVCVVKFVLDGVTYQAEEDPNDGYRSYMEDLVVVEEPCRIRLPNIEVVCHMEDDDEYARNDILVFVDALNGKTILKLGTGNYDDYYPYCVMDYTPENMSCNADKENNK